MPAVLAVDLGATSVRVCRVDLEARPPTVHVVHRHHHGPVIAADGSQRWDWPRLVAEVERGLALGLDRGPVASIGVDTWGVDYGLIGNDGRLVSAPYCYRDRRTAGWRSVAERLGPDRLYRTTGIRSMGANTLFQLAVHDREELRRADRLLMLPELLVHALTGSTRGEATSASTTELVDLATGTWAADLLDEIGVNAALLPAIAAAATPAGAWHGVPVHLVGGHDTASAIAALPPSTPGRAFVSSGTWLLVGCERPRPDLSEAARTADFTNERGVLGGIRFLKNVNGLWILEQCRAAWGHPPITEVLAAAEQAPPHRWTPIDATAERFVAPADMEGEIRRAAGMGEEASRAQVARSILESLAVSTAAVLDELSRLVSRPVSSLTVLGGGAQIGLLNRLTEEACGIPVHIGAVEATSLGNAIVQGVAIGLFAGLEEGRASLTLPD